MSVWLPLAYPLAGKPALNPGMRPSQESNQRPFGSQAHAQSTEPHQPGLHWNMFSSAPGLYPLEANSGR